MGKWVEVFCNCDNRTPIPNSHSLFGRPHRKKRRLTKREKQEVDEWERTTKNMYECGHRNGVLIEFWPGDIIKLGNLIAGILHNTAVTFDIFANVGDWRCYEDELLLISPDEADLWLAEISEIRQCILGCGQLPPERGQMLVEEFNREELDSRIDLQTGLDKIAQKMPLTRSLVAALQHNVQPRFPDKESALEKIDAALTDSNRLCEMSRESGNPIRFLW